MPILLPLGFLTVFVTFHLDKYLRTPPPRLPAQPHLACVQLPASWCSYILSCVIVAPQ